MSLADQLLIGWWVAVFVVPIVLFVLFRLHTRQETQDVILAMSRGVSWQELRYPRPAASSPVIKLLLIVFTVALIFLVISFCVIVWMHNETRLYVLSNHFLFALFGTGLLGVSFAKTPPGFYGRFRLRGMRTYQPKPGSLGSKAMRVLFFSIGCLIFGFALHLLFGDIALPRRAIEGRVDNISTRQGRYWSPNYRIVVDGHRYDATREVYSELRIGQRVRVEIGTGSNTIFRATPVQ